MCVNYGSLLQLVLALTCLDYIQSVGANSHRSKRQNSIGCIVPPPTDGGEYILGTCAPTDTSPDCTAPVGNTVPFDTELIMQCFDGYSLLPGKDNRIYCSRTRTWSPAPTCRRACSPLIHPHLEIECNYLDFAESPGPKSIPCDKPVLQGTTAIAKCKSGFKPKEQRLSCWHGDWDVNLMQCEPGAGGAPSATSNEVRCGIKSSYDDSNPWHARIYWFEKGSDGRSTYSFHCGGSLIGRQTVLTAAHCGYRQDRKFPVSQMYVALDKTDSLWELDDPDTQKFSVTAFETYPNYAKQSSSDIAVITLSKPAELKSSVTPVCLNSQSNRFRNERAVGMAPGWGNGASADTSEDSRLVQVPYVSQAKCQELLEKVARQVKTQDKFCAGEEGFGLKTLYGAGLAYQDGSQYYIVGVMSKRLPRSDLLGIGFYTNVSEHYNWITKFMAQKSK